MSKKISYSAWTKYMNCPKMYDFHYNDRLRPQGTSSALVFGVAIDEALNHMLLTKEPSLPKFQEKFKWEDMQEVVWDPRDLDYDLFTEEQLQSIKGKGEAFASWACMRIKGRLILDAYNKRIFPLIEEVISVQQNLRDRPGVLDCVLKLRGNGTVLIDHKTSARPYKDNAVTSDPQLALYAASEGYEKAGFIVMVKEIRKNTKKICKTCNFNGSFTRHATCPQTVNGKRCRGEWDKSFSPEGQIQLIIDDVPKVNKDLIQESLSQVEAGIKAGIFPRNLKACGKMYGKPCPYINKCWKNDEIGLECKDKKEKK